MISSTNVLGPDMVLPWCVRWNAQPDENGRNYAQTTEFENNLCQLLALLFKLA